MHSKHKKLSIYISNWTPFIFRLAVNNTWSQDRRWIFLWILGEWQSLMFFKEGFWHRSWRGLRTNVNKNRLQMRNTRYLTMSKLIMVCESIEDFVYHPCFNNCWMTKLESRDASNNYQPQWTVCLGHSPSWLFSGCIDISAGSTFSRDGCFCCKAMCSYVDWAADVLHAANEWPSCSVLGCKPWREGKDRSHECSHGPVWSCHGEV